MADRYPAYDVLAKRDSPSWNEQTRRVIDERLAIDPDRHEFLADDEWRTLCALCARIAPSPPGRGHAPVAAMIDQKLRDDARDGFRDARLPPLREAWRRGLAALAAEARARHGAMLHEIAADAQDALLTAVQNGQAHEAAWGDMPPDLFFRERILVDALDSLYAWPGSWSAIGFGGPASPRGYVRMNYDRRDPWEGVEAKPGREQEARAANARIR
jgi:hypothetical protein